MTDADLDPDIDAYLRRVGERALDLFLRSFDDITVLREPDEPASEDGTS